MRGVTGRYGRKEAVGIHLDHLHAGECVGLVGHNGAGKSTLIKMMLGLVRPSSGSVIVPAKGRRRARGAGAADRLSPRERRSLSLDDRRGILAFYARLKRQPVSRNRRAAGAGRYRLCGASACRPLFERHAPAPRARAGSIGHPRALLLDEPTTGLEPAVRQSFYEIVRELRRGGAMMLSRRTRLLSWRGRSTGSWC